MKSTALKKTGFSLTNRYLALYALLFLGALLLFFEHFTESPMTVGEVRETPSVDQVRPETGYLAPPFTARNLQGNRVHLSDYKGQVVILNLWATWCAPCRVEMPGMERMYRRFRSEGLTILAVSIDKNADDSVKSFTEAYGLSFPVLLDPEREVENKYPTFTVPTTFVIDRQGRIAAKVDGAKNWESEETFQALRFLLDRA